MATAMSEKQMPKAEMSEAEMEAATAPAGRADGSAPVSKEELDRRWAQGLASPFDPDDDDLDEDMNEPEAADKKPEGEKKGAEAEAGDEEGDADEKAPEPDADEGEKAEETAGGEAEKEPEVDPVVAALHERAKAYKIDVSKITDPVALEASIEAVERLIVAAGEEVLAAEEEAAKANSDREPEADADDKGDAEKEKAEADPADKNKPDPKKFDDKGKKVRTKLEKLAKLNRDEYAPELLDALDEVGAVIAELRAENDDLRSAREADRNASKAERERQEAALKKQQAERDEAEAAESTRRIDGFFENLAKESTVWAETFGTAKGAELLKTDEGKKQFANRVKATRQGEAYVIGLQSRKLPTGTFDASLSTGVRIAFGDKYAEAAAKKVAEKVKERRDSGIPRPNVSRSASPRGSALRATLKKHGMPINGED